MQLLLAVAYSSCEMTTDDEPVQGQPHGMTTPPSTTLYKRHRFPAEIISHCVWLYFRFSLSYRDVQEMMAERGVIVSHEAVRYWGRKFDERDGCPAADVFSMSSRARVSWQYRVSSGIWDSRRSPCNMYHSCLALVC